MAEHSTRTTDRVLDLLTTVCEGTGLTLSDCARAAGLPASTTLRTLQGLVDRGFVTRDGSSRYRPGPLMMRLGAASLSQDNLVWVASRLMRQVVQATGESVYLAVEYTNAYALYIHVIEGTHSVRHANWVGRTVPLADSAIGAALTGAVAPGDFIVTDAGVEADVTAIATPIVVDGHLRCALNLVVPSYRMTASKAQRYGRLLSEAAQEIARSFSAPSPLASPAAPAHTPVAAPTSTPAPAPEQVRVHATTPPEAR